MFTGATGDTPYDAISEIVLSLYRRITNSSYPRLGVQSSAYKAAFCAAMAP